VVNPYQAKVHLIFVFPSLTTDIHILSVFLVQALVRPALPENLKAQFAHRLRPPTQQSQTITVHTHNGRARAHLNPQPRPLPTQLTVESPRSPPRARAIPQQTDGPWTYIFSHHPVPSSSSSHYSDDSARTGDNAKMSGRASTPARQRPTCGPMEPPVTPGPGHSTPTTPLNKQGTTLPHTPQPPHSSPSADGAQKTPGGSKIECTLDESLYKKVEIHTAKCTECDKHNHEVMRRCPGCTFQICTPCYNERLSEGRTLLHAQMKKPGTPTVASPARAARVKIDPSTPRGSKASKVSQSC
jgi:hypothetical protein